MASMWLLGFALAAGDVGHPESESDLWRTVPALARIAWFPVGGFVVPTGWLWIAWLLPVLSPCRGNLLAWLLGRFLERERGPRVWLGPCALALLSTSSFGKCALAPYSESTVGIPARITDLVLPGTELAVAPQDSRTAVVVRIARVAPHGTAFRYDLEWTGLDPGEHDLRAFLRRKDGTPTSDLPPIPVTVRTLLPAGQVVPHHPGADDVPRFGGYTTLLWAGGALWVAGLAWILFGFRKRPTEDAAQRVRPRTLAERLRPLVESALAGRLSRAERAQLELSLVAWWRTRLGLDDRHPEAAHAALREHAEAGPLLRQLDEWLHKPGARADVDLGLLLAPYRELPADAIDLPDAPARS